MKFKYILFTYDALLEFASGRTFQSAEFSQSEQLCGILMQKSCDWSHPVINIVFTDNQGVIFYTQNIDKKQGLLFDLDTFAGFENKEESVITIFQKTIKYSIHYFDKQPLAPCEHDLSTDKAIVYPYPFTATKGVVKVLLDKNSTKQNRKNQNFLVAFYFGTDTGNFIQTNLNKAVSALNEIKPQHGQNKVQEVESLVVSAMSAPEFSINSPMPYQNWNEYLTKKQRTFILRPLKGAERLEGPAGSGKTLSLILRCIHLIEENISRNESYKIIFITHSIATKDRIIDLFSMMYPKFKEHQETIDAHPDVSILITTLQEWSKENLGANVIYDTEVIDRDAGISKGYQLMMIEEAYEKVKSETWKGFEVICSHSFAKFINTSPKNLILEMMQYEISVIIKGRADGNQDKYNQLERPEIALPLITNEDKTFMYMVYEKYQESLEHSGLFDTDDITLSALGQLDTPIWKRRSIKEGYDACFVDEAHLFNFNELSVFHCLNKPKCKNHIVYVLDKSQYVGEVGFSDADLISLEDSKANKTKLTTIFRSSPDIVNLAFNVLSSNVGLFTHFENPLDCCSYCFTSDEEKKCKRSSYSLYVSDDAMVTKAINEAEEYCADKKIRKSDVLIVVTDDYLLNNGVIKYLRDANKPYVELQSRNDYNTVAKAKSSNKFIVSGIDYVGGLEFDAVFIIGVDKGRVPPSSNVKEGNYQFTNFAWHNRMYVAISRAKYYLGMYGNSLNGASPVLETAIANKILDYNTDLK